MLENNPPGNRRSFIIHFPQGYISPAMQVSPDEDVEAIIDTFGLITPRPCIFITGGAGGMSDEDVHSTETIIRDGVAAFAKDYHCTVVDGGTEAGVMKMIGNARRQMDYKFPLVGVAPLGKVSYPGWQNPGHEAYLEAGHSHFVLVRGDEWGDESHTLVNLALRVSGMSKSPVIGVLINGGRIAEKEVYLATSRQDPKIPILILDGSGRTADTISTAYKTGRADSAIIKTIIAGGDIKITSLREGAAAMYQALHDHFQKQVGKS